MNSVTNMRLYMPDFHFHNTWEQLAEYPAAICTFDTINLTTSNYLANHLTNHLTCLKICLNDARLFKFTYFLYKLKIIKSNGSSMLFKWKGTSMRLHHWFSLNEATHWVCLTVAVSLILPHWGLLSVAASLRLHHFVCLTE